MVIDVNGVAPEKMTKLFGELHVFHREGLECTVYPSEGGESSEHMPASH